MNARWKKQRLRNRWKNEHDLVRLCAEHGNAVCHAHAAVFGCASGKYKAAFRIDGKKRILEIGCGPGALTQSLARWYPASEVIGTDRDSAFIQFAAQQAPGVVSDDEICKMKKSVNQRYDRRIALYCAGNKQWDVSVSLTMVLRGVK